MQVMCYKENEFLRTALSEKIFRTYLAYECRPRFLRLHFMIKTLKLNRAFYCRT